jgi:hypothetical protein
MTNKKLQLILFIVSALIIHQGCKKSVFKRHAEGKILDITDGVPLSEAKVAIFNEQVEFLGKTTSTELTSGTTDKDGEFEMSYNTLSDGTNIVYAHAQNYFFDPTKDFVQVNRSTRKRLEIKLTPKSQILVAFNITDTTIDHVFFQFYADSKSSDDLNAYNTEQKYFTVRGNFTNKYFYIIYYKSSNSVTKEGSIFCPKFDNPGVQLNIKL